MEKFFDLIRSVDFKTHLKAVAWNGGMMALAFFLDYLSTQLAGFGLSQTQTMILGLVLARVSKEINARLSQK